MAEPGNQEGSTSNLGRFARTLVGLVGVSRASAERELAEEVKKMERADHPEPVMSTPTGEMYEPPKPDVDIVIKDSDNTTSAEATSK